MDYTSSLPETAAKENNSRIAPNPAKDRLTIDFDTDYRNIIVEIYDQTGRRLEVLTLPSACRSHTMDLQNYKSGVYFIRIHADNEESLHKVIIR